MIHPGPASDQRGTPSGPLGSATKMASGVRSGGKRRPRLLRPACLLLLGLLLAFGVHRQSRSLVAGLSDGIDRANRHAQVHAVLLGLDPTSLPKSLRGRKDQWRRGELADEGLPFDPLLQTSTHARPVGDYPPWAYAWGYAFHWPRHRVGAALWYALAQGLALFGLCTWAWRTGGRVAGVPPPWRMPLALGFMVAVLPMTAISRTLRWGNYGLIVVALLAAAHLALARRRTLTAGLLVAVSLIKPTLSLPFLLPLATFRRAAGLAVALLATAAAAIVAASWAGTEPLGMLRRSLEHVVPVAHQGTGLVAAGHAAGFDNAMLLQILGVGICATAWWIVWHRRHDDPLVSFAACGVAARFFTYHRLYDDVLLVFLAVALLRLAARSRRWLDACIAAAVILSLWTPTSVHTGTLVPALAGGLWILALGWLLWRERPGPEPGLTGSPDAAAGGPDDATRSTDRDPGVRSG